MISQQRCSNHGNTAIKQATIELSDVSPWTSSDPAVGLLPDVELAMGHDIDHDCGESQ